MENLEISGNCDFQDWWSHANE